MCISNDIFTFTVYEVMLNLLLVAILTSSDNVALHSFVYLFVD